MKTRQRLALAALVAASALLPACGFDNTETPLPPATPANQVPASATASPLAYEQYVGSLAPTETGQPLDVSNVVPPTSETAAPMSF
jgi:hypothetical protein